MTIPTAAKNKIFARIGLVRRVTENLLLVTVGSYLWLVILGLPDLSDSITVNAKHVSIKTLTKK